MIDVSIGKWRVLGSSGKLPSIFDEYVKRASFTDLVDLDDHDQSGICFLAVSDAEAPNDDGWPRFVFAQRYSPSGAGFKPGICLVPETSLLLMGAGTRLSAYDLSKPSKVWGDTTELGFWGWERRNKTILMKAEIEFAAWNLRGEKLWSKFVEPPWEYSLDESQVRLDVMGDISEFNIATGE